MFINKTVIFDLNKLDMTNTKDSRIYSLSTLSYKITFKSNVFKVILTIISPTIILIFTVFFK